MESAVHPFEKTLGPGPYKLVGFFDLGRVLAALNAGNINGYNNGLAAAPKDVSVGSCDHCGHGILYNYIVMTGEGKKFAVGSDCILKLNGKHSFEGLSEVEKTIKLQKREQAKVRREAQRQALALEVKQLVLDNEANIRANTNKNGLTYEMILKRSFTTRTLGGYKLFKKNIERWSKESK